MKPINTTLITNYRRVAEHQYCGDERLANASNKMPLINMKFSHVLAKEPSMIRDVMSGEQHSDHTINQSPQLFEPESPIPNQILGVYDDSFSKHIVENTVMNLKRYASIVLTMSGIILMGMGIYFTLVRPALLPEDIRYIDLSSA
jgi:hypothetical protein